MSEKDKRNEQNIIHEVNNRDGLIPCKNQNRSFFSKRTMKT